MLAGASETNTKNSWFENIITRRFYRINTLQSVFRTTNDVYINVTRYQQNNIILICLRGISRKSRKNSERKRNNAHARDIYALFLYIPYVYLIYISRMSYYSL